MLALQLLQVLRVDQKSLHVRRPVHGGAGIQTLHLLVIESLRVRIFVHWLDLVERLPFAWREA